MKAKAVSTPASSANASVHEPVAPAVRVPAAATERARILKLSKKWLQDRVSMRCGTQGCKGRLLVIDQPSARQGGGGGACGSSISVDIEYAHKCPECFATATSSESLKDVDF